MKRVTSFLTPALTCALLAGCPEEHPRAPAITGIAASGAPLQGGTVYLVDGAGRTASGAVSATGHYRISVKGMTGPFLLEALGRAGGQLVILHSAATTRDVAEEHIINVTPLTELVTAYLLEAWPSEVFRDANRSLAPLTDDALDVASQTVRVQVGAALDAFEATGDVRTAAFEADGTGMDAALEALKLAPAQDVSTGAPRYELSLSTGSTPIGIDPAAPEDTALIALSPADRSTVDAARAALPSIDARLQALASAFATHVPSADEIRALFASDAEGFRHNGLALDSYLETVLLEESNVGFTVSPAVLDGVQDARHVWVGIRMTTAMKEEPLSAGTMDRPGVGAAQWEERFLMQRSDGGAWQIAGNQAMADCAVSNMARLIGSSVETMVELFVSSTQLDPRVGSVRVTGPGLPEQGLTLVRSPPEYPRENLIIENDTWHWNTINDARCTSISPPPANCGLDWSQVAMGSRFTFEFFDGSEISLGTEHRRLRGTPRTASEWLARKSSVFPLITNPAAYQPTWDNVTDLSEGAPFVAGGTEVATWRIPADPSVRMHFVGLWRGYTLDDSGLPADARQEGCSHLLHGAASSSRSCTWVAPFEANWAWIDLGARDVYGNKLWDQVNPEDPG